MAREKMVTRTVTATVAKVMVVEIASAKAYTTEITLTGVFKDNADLLKTLKKNDTNELVYVAIVSTETKETLYGMPESEFIKYAKELPPRPVYETWTAKNPES